MQKPELFKLTANEFKEMKTVILIRVKTSPWKTANILEHAVTAFYIVKIS
jgi:hypothetical protein